MSIRLTECPLLGTCYEVSETQRTWKHKDDATKDASGQYVRRYDPARAKRAADPADPECSQFSWVARKDLPKSDPDHPDHQRG